jgi:glutamate N-acetyltransferase/amino-acid N-acetyltransferase
MSAGQLLPRSPLAPEVFADPPRVAGCLLATGSLGLYRGVDRDDLLVAHFPLGATAAGVFTTSQTRSADIDWCRAALRDGGGCARVLVVNAGNSNAFTGRAGLEKNAATVAAAAKLAGCRDSEVFIAATGVIGEPLPPRLVADGVVSVWPGLASPDWKRAANAIRTTDTFEKAAGAETEVDGVPVRIAGFAKGSGMIAPNMATTLNFIFTDAALSAEAAQRLLSRLCDVTFNCISVDGDTSTSDTLMLFATGASGAPAIEDCDDPRLGPFAAALHDVMKDLALQIVRDGEGASKLIEISVGGADSDTDARLIAASIANSPLVKTAIAAGDANWGRIVMAVGKAGPPIDRDRLSIRFGEHLVADAGARAPGYEEAAASRAVEGPHVAIHVDIGRGSGFSRVWTCDLTDGYVRINGAYRS